MTEYTKEQLELCELANEYMEESLQLILSGKIKDAEKTTIRARDIYEQLQNKGGLASALNRLSVIYDELGDDSISLQCLLDATEYALMCDDYLVKAKLFNNLGCEYLYTNSYDQALEFFRMSFDFYDKACEEDYKVEQENHSFRMILNLNFCTIYSVQGDIEHARRHYLMAKEDLAYNTDADLILVYKCSEGLFFWRAGEKEKARGLVTGILDTVRETEYTADYLEVVSDLLKLLREMKDFDKWKEALEIMEDRLTVAEGSYIKIEMLKRWIDFYEESGDTEKYTETCVKFVQTMKAKAEEDYKKRAENIDLQIENRRAARQKELDDTMVYTDTLTGVGNRNKMLEDSIKILADSIENDSRIGVGLIDIDFFKECNDNYGHISGDNCLKKVAAAIEMAVGEKGHVYRYGGDEFLLLLPDASEEQLLNLGEAIQKAVDEEAIPNEKSYIKPFITVSQGYTRARAEEGDTIDLLVNLADKVLYSVKRNGRNGYKYIRFSEIVKSC